jgi:hypothetical protein
LITRRLLERGVRFVQVWSGAGQPWDNHENLEKDHRKLAGDWDQVRQVSEFIALSGAACDCPELAAKAEVVANEAKQATDSTTLRRGVLRLICECGRARPVVAAQSDLPGRRNAQNAPPRWRISPRRITDLLGFRRQPELAAPNSDSPAPINLGRAAPLLASS